MIEDAWWRFSEYLVGADRFLASRFQHLKKKCTRLFFENRLGPFADGFDLPWECPTYRWGIDQRGLKISDSYDSLPPLYTDDSSAD